MIREKMGYNEFKSKEKIEQLQKAIEKILAMLDGEQHIKALGIVSKYTKYKEGGIYKI